MGIWRMKGTEDLRPRLFARRFGRRQAGSLGVEEELFVVDAGTSRPAPLPEHMTDGVRRKGELFTSMVELTTPVCETSAEAAAALRELRRAAARDLGAHGLAMLGSGTHPFAEPAEQELAADPALRRFAHYAGPAARVQLCCGLHVHVSVPSGQACLDALEFALPWLPVVLALSANSPYFRGEETGYASTRAGLLTRLPRSGAPPVYGTLDDWEGFARRLVDLRLADDYTRIWWDIRPHPRLGTLEVRIADQPTSIDTTGALVALLHALVVSAGGEPRAADRGVYVQNRWAAQRFGVEAGLIAPDGRRLATVPELTDELLELVEPAARRLGCEDLLLPLRTLARRSQADDQLAAGQESGLAALAAGLTRRTDPRM